ncbi:hypothetical protein JB92DRAFT_1669373 [Gautieria morchelliformis]|nr:hypothetical protein JB92DRAFT_1669373 [Gautieria morchelliformis]
MHLIRSTSRHLWPPNTFLQYLQTQLTHRLQLSLSTRPGVPMRKGQVNPLKCAFFFSTCRILYTVVLVKTVQELQPIEVWWIVPSQSLLYRVKPVKYYLTRFLHHKGDVSLCRVLRDRGWIDRLWASRCEGDRERGFETYHVAMA